MNSWMSDIEYLFILPILTHGKRPVSVSIQRVRSLMHIIWAASLAETSNRSFGVMISPSLDRIRIKAIDHLAFRKFFLRSLFFQWLRSKPMVEVSLSIAPIGSSVCPSFKTAKTIGFGFGLTNGRFRWAVTNEIAVKTNKTIRIEMLIFFIIFTK